MAEPKEKFDFIAVLNKIPWWVWLIIAAIIAWIIYGIYEKVKQKADANKLAALHANSQSTSVSGVPINLGTTAATVYGDLFGGWFGWSWFGFTVNSTGIITAVHDVQPKDIANLISIYKSYYNRDLKADLIQYLSDTDWETIKPVFE